jgi:hypothetical protein
LRVVAVTRAGLPTIDVGDLVGQEGDVLHLVVTYGVEAKLQTLFPASSLVSGSNEEAKHL